MVDQMTTPSNPASVPVDVSTLPDDTTTNDDTPSETETPGKVTESSSGNAMMDGEPQSEGSQGDSMVDVEDIEDQSAKSSDAGGCSVATGSSRSPWALWLAAAALAAGLRRRRVRDLALRS
jgi:MYXO-CTERM domain-containing protein